MALADSSTDFKSWLDTSLLSEIAALPVALKLCICFPEIPTCAE